MSIWVTNYEEKEREHLYPFLAFLQNTHKLTELEVMGLIALLWSNLGDKVNLAFAHQYGFSKIMGSVNTIIDKHYATNIEDKFTLYLKNIYTDNFTFSVDNAPTPVDINPKTFLSEEYVLKRISQRWADDGKLYSDRIWENKTKLKQMLYKNVKESLMNGADVRKVSAQITKEFGVSYSNVERLVRTETNFVLNQAQIDALNELGFDKYEYIATLDNRTSNICRRKHGKVFNVSDARVGVNMPPLHPNCRSTIAPYIE